MFDETMFDYKMDNDIEQFFSPKNLKNVSNLPSVNQNNKKVQQNSINERIAFVQRAKVLFNRAKNNYIHQLEECKSVAINMGNQLFDLNRRLVEAKTELNRIGKWKSDEKPDEVVNTIKKQLTDRQTNNTNDCMARIEMLRYLDRNLALLIEKMKADDTEGSKPWMKDNSSIDESSTTEKKVILAIEKKIEILAININAK